VQGSRPSWSWRLSIASLAAALVCASPVRGDDADKAREHYTVGLRAYDAGKYDEAIAEFEAAYRYKDAPGLLYNIAQAYRLSNRPEQAVRFYRTYLERKPDAANHAEAEAKIERLASILEERKVRTAPVGEAAAATMGERAAPATAGDPTPEHRIGLSEIAAVPRTPALVAPALAPVQTTVPAEALAARPPARFWTARRAGWVATGAGVAALALAAYFGLEAHSASNQMEADGTARRPFDPAVDAKGQKAQTLSRIFLASAAVGFGASGFFFRAASRTPIEAGAVAGEVSR